MYPATLRASQSDERLLMQSTGFPGFTQKSKPPVLQLSLQLHKTAEWKGSCSLYSSSAHRLWCTDRQFVSHRAVSKIISSQREETHTKRKFDWFFCVTENEWLYSWYSCRQDLRGLEKQNGNDSCFRQTHKTLDLISYWWPLHVTHTIFTLTPHTNKKEGNLIFCLVWRKSYCFWHTEA